jgi:hypothetical protein
MQIKFIKNLVAFFSVIVCLTVLAAVSDVAPFDKLVKPPLDEHQFGIYVGKDRVGFYNQKFTETPEGYRIEATGGVNLKVMGFVKDSTSKETYLVDKNLALRSFDITQTLNGINTKITGTKYDTSLRIKIDKSGKIIEKQMKFSDNIIPGPALNIFPLMQASYIDKTFKVHTFDIEEIRIHPIKITVFKEETAPTGQPGLKMRNTLYPFVHNDIWVDANGNTIWESVRDGLVITKYEISRLRDIFK